MESLTHGVEGFMYPNEIELQWSILIVLYPYITGLVAGAFILASLERVFNVEEVRPTYRLALLTALAFLLVAPLPLQLHLGHPERSFEMYLTPLVGGQAPISIGPYLHHVLAAKKKGEPADLIPLSPMLVSPRPTGILSKARHPNAGKLLAGWLSTPPAQKILEDASSRGSASPGSGTQTEELLRKSGIELIVDNESIAARRVEFERLMQKVMGITK